MQESKLQKLNYLDLYTDLWKEILLLTDEPYLKSLLNQNMKMGKKLASRKASHISYCLKQAKDYFDSSKHASLITKPNLIYYGLVSLVSALIIYRERDMSLDTMKASHGLSVIYPTFEGDTPTRSDFLHLSVKPERNGTFSTFSHLDVSDRFNMRWDEQGLENSSRTFKKSVDISSYLDQQFSLESLLIQNCEAIKEVNICLNLKSSVFDGEPMRLIDDHQPYYYLKFSKDTDELTRDTIVAKFDILASYDHVGKTQDNIFFRGAETNPLPHTKTSLSGGTGFISDKNTHNFSDFHNYYLSFYILGMVSRYKPNLWGNWLYNPNKSIKLLADSLCSSAIIKIPLLFLSELHDKHFILMK